MPHKPIFASFHGEIRTLHAWRPWLRRELSRTAPWRFKSFLGCGPRNGRSRPLRRRASIAWSCGSRVLAALRSRGSESAGWTAAGTFTQARPSGTCCRASCDISGDASGPTGTLTTFGPWPAFNRSGSGPGVPVGNAGRIEGSVTCQAPAFPSRASGRLTVGALLTWFHSRSSRFRRIGGRRSHIVCTARQPRRPSGNTW